MIELFDASRLVVKRDHTLALACSTLLLVAGVMAAYSAFLQVQLHSTKSRTQALQAQLAALDTAASPAASKSAAAAPRDALMADLQRQAEQMERDATHAGLRNTPNVVDKTPTPVQWMEHLAALVQADTSLQKVDIERSGSARIEGLATSPQALNALVQAWEKQPGLALLQPRSIDIKQEKLPAPFLRFQLRATPLPATAAATPPPAAAASAAEAQP